MANIHLELTEDQVHIIEQALYDSVQSLEHYWRKPRPAQLKNAGINRRGRSHLL